MDVFTEQLAPMDKHHGGSHRDVPALILHADTRGVMNPPRKQAPSPHSPLGKFLFSQECSRRAHTDFPRLRPTERARRLQPARWLEKQHCWAAAAQRWLWPRGRTAGDRCTTPMAAERSLPSAKRLWPMGLEGGRQVSLGAPGAAPGPAAGNPAREVEVSLGEAVAAKGRGARRCHLVLLCCSPPKGCITASGAT